jgi:radical SAM/Cys-rich protein
MDAGPGRKEMMSAKTLDQVVAFARSGHLSTIDITGGAPELYPLIGSIIQRLKPLCGTLILRSNLTALARKWKTLIKPIRDNQVTVVASLPSLYEVQAESVRGKGSFRGGIQTLKRLTALGYGKENTGLELNLVLNPSGAFLPPAQIGIEKRYHTVLYEKWGIVFNRLYSFANVPLGRFRDWLIESGNYEKYIQKLADAFNPCTGEGLDCDFNQAIRLFMGKQKRHLSDLTHLPEPGELIALADHCYTCTAGSGFT